MPIWYIGLGLGALGGLTRALLGIRKAMREEDYEIQWGPAVLTMFIGAMTGVISTLVPGTTNYLAFTAGYLGDDAIQGFFPKTKK